MTMIALFLPCFEDAAVVKHGFTEELGISVAGVPVPLPHSVDYLSVSSFCDVSRVPWSEQYECTHPWCPRTFLAFTIARLQTCFKLELQVGFETEFILLKRVADRDGNEKYVPLEKSAYCQSSGFDHASTVLRDICDALENAGQRVLQVHGESADGQFEIVTGYGDVLSQADAFLIRKEIIQSVATEHGLYATFLPKYFKDQAGSACHVHFSFVRKDSRRMEEDKKCEFASEISLSEDLQKFMAGIIENMGGLLMFTAGSPNSTRRIQPGCWAGAYQCWGFSNKEAPLRVVDALDDHVEYKAFDGSANPYMGLSGLINAGIDGLVRNLELKPAVQVDPALLPPNRCKRLPESFAETVLYFEENLGDSKNGFGMMHEWYTSCMDDKETLGNFFEDFMSVKYAELERFKNMTFEEEVDVLYNKY